MDTAQTAPGNLPPKPPPPPRGPDMPSLDETDDSRLIGRGLLAQSLMLEEQGPESLIRIAALVICIMVMIFITWAALTSVTEVAVSSGEVSPVGSVKRVQHLEGGIIKTIYIGEGDLVETGQVLMQLEDGGIQPELDQLNTRLTGFEYQRAQLRSVVGGKDFDFAAVPEQYRDLARSQSEVLQAKMEAAEAQAEVLRQQIKQRKNELLLVRDQVAGTKRQIEILQEQVQMRLTLKEKGLISKVVLLNDQRELARADGSLAELRGKIRTSRDAINEAKSRLIETESRGNMEAHEQLANVATEIAELKEAIRLNEDRVRRLKIRAPQKGIVQELQTETVGGVLSPGSTVLELIPFAAELLVEARITTADIGFIYVGQETVVKVTAYDFTKYGGIDGTIEKISPTTVEDEEGNTFYRARIRLEKNYVGEDPTRNLVLPGMEVVADIRTGRKTLLEFLLKPVVKALEESFRER